MNKLQDEKELLETNVCMKLMEMEAVTVFIEHAHETTFRVTQKRRQQKYDQLLSKQQGGHEADTDRPGQHHRHLDSGEITLLKKGLNFVVTPQNLPIDNLITAT